MFGSIGTNFVFYDGPEKSPSAPLHRDLTPLVSTFWPWLDWHQIFGEGFMMAVKSIGVKILAMDRLAARVL